MTTVRFIGLDAQGNNRELGRVTWDGKVLAATPEALRGVLARPLRAKGGATVTADDPEAFLEAMRLNYTSAYFRATVPEGDAAGMAVAERRRATP